MKSYCSQASLETITPPAYFEPPMARDRPIGCFTLPLLSNRRGDWTGCEK